MTFRDEINSILFSITRVFKYYLFIKNVARVVLVDICTPYVRWKENIDI